MQLPNQPPLRLRPELAELDRITAYIESFAEQHNLSPADTYALSLAAEELFANTVKHSRPPATWVEFFLVRGGDDVIATYSDDALPYDPTLEPAPDTSLPAEVRPVGGLGIHFIRKTMQSFNYARLEGRNVITLTRRLKN
jgi:serine/threonine-protein kinase RsbW